MVPPVPRDTLHVARVLSLMAERAPGAVAEERRGVLLVASAAAVLGGFFNAALRIDPGLEPADVFTVARTFAAERGRTVMVWGCERTDPDLITAANENGLTFAADLLGMALAPDGYRRGALPEVSEAPEVSDAPEVLDALEVPDAPVQLVEVRDERGAEEFAEVHRVVFAADGRPPAGIEHFAAPEVLLGPDVSAFVLRAGERPVAAAMTVRTPPVAGIYWVATRPEERRRGFGERVTRAAVEAGLAAGARRILLQATPLGEPVYRRLGFVPVTRYRRAQLPPAEPLPG